MKRASPGDDWLPPGWTTQVKVRTSGTKAGVADKFYYEPVTGRKFRSKNEVMYYLEHGTPKKKPIKKTDNGNTESQGGSRTNKAVEEPAPPLNFNFEDVPDKVTWTLTFGEDQAWSASIGGLKVPDPVVQDWRKAFSYMASQNGKTSL